MYTYLYTKARIMQKFLGEKGSSGKFESSPVVELHDPVALITTGAGRGRMSCGAEGGMPKPGFFMPLGNGSHSCCPTMLGKQDVKKSWGAKKSGPRSCTLSVESGTLCLPLLGRLNPTSERLSPTLQPPTCPRA